jgi:hypothetical protein
MKKYSRKHGMMWLSSYAPGDGSIDFVWVPDRDRNGACLTEFVSESDISEWLASDEQKHKWAGWEIITTGRGPERHYPAMNRLAHLVVRPFHSSKRLLMDDTEYEYIYHGRIPKDISYTSSNTDIYEVNDKSRGKITNMNIMLGLLYFLNHEEDFERSGYQTRETKPRAVPA